MPTAKLMSALQKLTQTEMAESAGISEHQRNQALRVANVPVDQFEAAIEQPKAHGSRPRTRRASNNRRSAKLRAIETAVKIRPMARLLASGM